MTRSDDTIATSATGVFFGSEQAHWDFEAWYRREYRPVLAYAIGLTGDLPVAEDIVQASFTAAASKWGELAGHPNPSGWIRRVVINKSTSRFRRLRTSREKRHFLVGEDVVDDLPDPEIWEAVRSLPRRQAQVIALHYLDDLPVLDIAEILDCSPGSVKTHLARGRGALRSKLGAADDS